MLVLPTVINDTASAFVCDDSYHCNAVQSLKAVTAYFLGELILPFGFAEQCTYTIPVYSAFRVISLQYP